MERANPVCVFEMVTATLGTTAPVGSETVPVNAPVPADCARSKGKEVDKTNASNTARKYLDAIELPPCSRSDKPLRFSTDPFFDTSVKGLAPRAGLHTSRAII
jgi:hypothetical protein